MLDAYIRKGAHLPIDPRPDVRRRVIEDAITSTLFTPIRFMPPSHASQILSLLSGNQAIPVPQSCNVELWRKFPAALAPDANETIEPDVVFDLHYAESTARTAIEIKWDDVLRIDQVRAQVGSGDLDLRAGDTFQHLSIVKFADVETFGFPKTKVREWPGILKDLKQAGNSGRIESKSKNVIRWCRDVALFLERLGIGSFEGFGHLTLRSVTQGIHVPVLRQFAWAELRSVRRVGTQLNFTKDSPCQ
jgi:hypothetical protein